MPATTSPMRLSAGGSGAMATGSRAARGHQTATGSAPPQILAELRGSAAAEAIPQIEAAVAAYPFATQYRTWPGPNSNTFTAWVARAVPALRLDLPPTAVGKDYLGPSQFLAQAPSGSGYQVSLFGLAGVLAAEEEGLEVNLLGMTFGIDPFDLALKVPGLGRLAAG